MFPGKGNAEMSIMYAKELKKAPGFGAFFNLAGASIECSRQGVCAQVRPSEISPRVDQDFLPSYPNPPPHD